MPTTFPTLYEEFFPAPPPAPSYDMPPMVPMEPSWVVEVIKQPLAQSLARAERESWIAPFRENSSVSCPRCNSSGDGLSWSWFVMSDVPLAGSEGIAAVCERDQMWSYLELVIS
jgi:hypothetical protein